MAEKRAKSGGTTRKAAARPADARTPEAFAAEFKSSMGAGSWSAAPTPVILCGEDRYRAARFANWLKNEALKHRIGCAVHFATEIATNSQLVPLRENVSSASLFAPASLVIIFDLDRMKKGLIAEIETRLGRPAPGVRCVATAEDLSALRTGAPAFVESAEIVLFETLSGAKLSRWIQKELAASGHSGGIAPEALEHLCASFSGDLAHLANDLERLSLSADRNETISKSLVEKLVTTKQERSSFQLLTELARRNHPASAALVQNLLSQGQHPLQLSSFLAKAFRTALTLKNRGEAGSAGINPWFARNVRPAVELFSAEEMIEALRSLALLDKQLKSSPLPPQELVLDFAARVSGRRAAA